MSSHDSNSVQAKRAALTLSHITVNIRRGSQKLGRAVRSLAHNSLIKTLGVFAAIALAALAALLLAFILRVAKPRSQITVSAFQVFGGDEKFNNQSGKALADLVVDDLHEILERAQNFSGNPFSSAKSFGGVPDMPTIPVDTSYGIEIKGVSLDQVFATWNHARYHEFQVSGDLLLDATGNHVVRLRYDTANRAGSYEKTLERNPSPAAFESTVRDLTLELVGEINPQAGARYLLATGFDCKSKCDDAWDTAVRFCWSWTKRRPNDPLALFYLGYSLRHTKHQEDALIFLDRAVQLDPHLYLALDLKSAILMDEGKFPDAESAVQSSVRIRRTPNAFMQLGVLYMLQGQPGKSLGYFETASSIDPNDVGAYLNQGGALRTLSRYEEAVKVYRDALLLQPANRVAVLGLARSLAHLGKEDEGLLICEETARLDGDNNAFLIDEGRVYLVTKETDKAIEKFEEAIKNGDTWEAHVQLGLAYLQKGDLDAARAKFQQLLDASSDNARIHYLMSKVLQAQGDSVNSQKEAAEAERLSPGSRYNNGDEW